ncbi:D-arabinitol 4-dehydrogenase [Polaromonas sp.]|uniref:D-arabinitol 4-dehydrogenase n=1 Tax=Polaromonas sp. TaxID=1869339 RepID=UPI00286A8D33|nr:D-arabinitol 4-dehydrogenase [Polaromonas sp.]
MPTSAQSPLVMLHLGLGSFHRAHQAVYLHELIETGDSRWVLAGGNIRPDMAETVAALQAQGGAYTLETVTPAQVRSYTRIESIKTIVPYDAELSGLLALGADTHTRIISVTVTEAGYYLDAQDRLDLNFDDLRADVTAAGLGQPVCTIYGALTAILRQRMQGTAGAVTLLNCDNLRHNGDRLRSGLLQFIALLPASADREALLQWVTAHTSCPNAMVDRITPRPTPDVAERVLAATRRVDAAAIMAESFIQWVIEDNFVNGRPDWEKVGVEMVASVAAHEEAKIRLLNATHSCIAWAGTLAGYHYIHEGSQDPVIRQFAYDYVTDDVIPVLSPSPLNLAKYRDVVLDRFSNPALKDTNQRVAMDGFSKIPGFIAATFRERLARGEGIASVAMLPALFLAYLQRWHRGQIPYTYQDQAMVPALAHAICEAADPVAAFCADVPLWGDLAGDARLVAALRRASARVSLFEKEKR